MLGGVSRRAWAWGGGKKKALLKTSIDPFPTWRATKPQQRNSNTSITGSGQSPESSCVSTCSRKFSATAPGEATDTLRVQQATADDANNAQQRLQRRVSITTHVRCETDPSTACTLPRGGFCTAVTEATRGGVAGLEDLKPPLPRPGDEDLSAAAESASPFALARVA